VSGVGEALDRLAAAIERTDPGWRERALQSGLHRESLEAALGAGFPVTDDLADWYGWANGSRPGLRTTDNSVVFIVDFLPLEAAKASLEKLGQFAYADGGVWLPLAHSRGGPDFALCCSGRCTGQVATVGPTYIAPPERRAPSLSRLIEWWTEPWRDGHWYRTAKGQRGDWESPHAHTGLV
jgi:hypothetical protein